MADAETHGDSPTPKTRIDVPSAVGVVAEPIAAALSPLVLWGTTIDETRLIIWGAVFALIATTPAGVLVIEMRGHRALADRVNDSIQLLYAAMFGVLPWLTPSATGTLPDTYLLFAAMVAITGALSTTVAQFPLQRRPRIAAVLACGASYAVAFAAQGEWALAGTTAVWLSLMWASTSRGGSVTMELIKLRDQSDFAAHHDELTELLNRRGLLAALENSLESGTAETLVILDLDDFKMLNDGLGHRCGDHVLRTVANRLVDAFPPGSTVTRLGGDGFASLIPSRDQYADHAPVLDRVLNSIQLPIYYDGHELTVRASVGVAAKRADITSSDWLAEADISMYRSKQSKQQSITFFDASLRREVTRTLEVEQRFRTALEDGSIVFWGQPLVTATDGTPAGLELLARWPQEDGSMISPEEFIPIAEQTSLIVELGRQALQTAASLLYDWNDKPGFEDLQVNVNVSPKHLGVSLIEDIGNAYPAMDDRLGIEFVETDLISTFGEDREKLEELRDTGLRTIIDDFGVGYSSLNYLRLMLFSEVKIDRSFLERIEVDPVRQQLIRTITEMASALDMCCVAEGVETKQAAQIVRDLGVDLLQGYVIARPQPLDVAQQTLRSMSETGADRVGSSAVIGPAKDPGGNREPSLP